MAARYRVGPMASDATRGEQVSSTLPIGVHVQALRGLHDPRGTLTEVFRSSWGVGVEPVQWNLVDNQPGVLRGVHVHVHHADYLLMASGEALIGLRDLRRNSPTAGLVALVPLDATERAALTIPPGVAHGFWFPVAGSHLYAVDHYWSPADELGCHWLDPELGIPWPDPGALVSERDAEAGSLAALLDELEPYQEALYPSAGTVPAVGEAPGEPAG